LFSFYIIFLLIFLFSNGRSLKLGFLIYFSKASVAQMAEQLICNQWVGGSIPFAGSRLELERFPSGQREQTVNLPAQPSEVQILPSPPNRTIRKLTTTQASANRVNDRFITSLFYCMVTAGHKAEI
jgi:hypothetical protein